MKLKNLLSTVAICTVIAMPAYAAKTDQEKQAEIKKAAEQTQKMLLEAVPNLGLDKLTPAQLDKVAGKVGNREIKVGEVLTNMQSLSKQMNQLPPDWLYYFTIDQMLKSEALKIKAEASKEKILKDPKVKAAIEKATQSIIAATYAEEHLENKVTDAP